MRLQTHFDARTPAICPSVIFITYTSAAGAEQRDYEQWLREVDIPFLDGITGIRHYANGPIERVLKGAPPGYG